ncbi:MAG: hypothetical protein ACOC2C_05615 [Cyclonatronaceae bacterium]
MDFPPAVPTAISFIFDENLPFKQRMKQVFEHQYNHMPVYRRFCDALRFAPGSSCTPPLLPVEAFREADIVSDAITLQPGTPFFQSSGTSGMKRSRHWLVDEALYKKSIFEGLRQFYPINDFVILAYTPGYNENPHSSLIYMLQQLIEADATGLSRFLELNQPISPMALDAIEAQGKRVLLFGAAFGLIDLAEHYPQSLPENSLIMETGGMKTHRREMSRAELHEKLAGAFFLDPAQVHSEYGMTELLSQAYADGSGWFRPPHWMKISIQNPENPLEALPEGEAGLIGIIDLANWHSCSFLLTGDHGVQRADGRFRVLGRYHPENLRGCNFLIDKD